MIFDNIPRTNQYWQNISAVFQKYQYNANIGKNYTKKYLVKCQYRRSISFMLGIFPMKSLDFGNPLPYIWNTYNIKPIFLRFCDHIGNILNAKRKFLKYWSFIGNSSIVKQILLRYWHCIANIYNAKSVFLWYWLYITNISDVHPHFYDIGIPINFFQWKASITKTLILHSQCVKLECLRYISCK